MDKPSDRRRARGFALYVGLDEHTARDHGIELADLVASLRQDIEKRVPGVATHAAIALSSEDAGGEDLEVVRRALHDPGKLQPRPAEEPDPQGVEIDISRKRVVIGSATAPLTYLEFELLQFLVLREGQSVPREAIINHLWEQGDREAPNERTIDVYIRRVRAKLEPYPDIIRTVRGQGYRFDRHADVTVRFGQAPSPDVSL